MNDICAAQGGWLCSELDCAVAGPASSLTPQEGQAQWFAVGDAATLALQAGRLVEYDILTRCDTACNGCAGCNTSSCIIRTHFRTCNSSMHAGIVPSAPIMQYALSSCCWLRRSPVGIVCLDIGASFPPAAKCHSA